MTVKEEMLSGFNVRLTKIVQRLSEGFVNKYIYIFLFSNNKILISF